MSSRVSGPQAQVWHGGHEFALTGFPAPTLGPGEAVAAIDLATVCGSDRHTVNGRRAGARPSILGHEAVGRIVEVHADGVRDVRGEPLRTGDRVVWGVTASCGHCDRCVRGLTAKCRRLLKTGHESVTSDWPLSGGYATHIHLRRGLTLVRVPVGVGDAAAAIAACAGATVVACLDAAGPQDLTGHRVVVNGAGMLGLFAGAMARYRGAEVVEVRDPSSERGELAVDFGATRSVVVPRGSRHMAEAAVFDIAVELSGASDGVRNCLASLDIGGCLVLAGSVAPAGTVELDPEALVRGRNTIVGVHNYEPEHLQTAVDFLAATAGRHDWDAVVAAPRPLSALPELLTTHETDLTILRRSVAPGEPAG